MTPTRTEPTLTAFRIEPVRKIGAGKVRDIYDVGDDRLLLVASDRISAYDVVLPDPIPDKGRVLTAISSSSSSCSTPRTTSSAPTSPNSSLPESDSPDPQFFAGRSMVVRKAEVVPVECVVQGLSLRLLLARVRGRRRPDDRAAAGGLVARRPTRRTDLHARDESDRRTRREPGRSGHTQPHRR